MIQVIALKFMKVIANQCYQMFYLKTKNPNLSKFCNGLAMEDVGIFCGRLVYFTAIWYFCDHLVCLVYGRLVYFFPDLYQEKSGNLAATTSCAARRTSRTQRRKVSTLLVHL
jgi:hypothetical protein